MLSHARDGTIIDQTVTDADGHAPLIVSGDALISVVFPAVIGPETTVRVVTTLAPAEQLTVFSSQPASTSQAAIGSLTIDGPPIAGADNININLGCATSSVTSLPATIEVPTCSLGTDTQLDVLVRASHLAGELATELDGYAAGRVSLANGTASFHIDAWTTLMATVPIEVSGPVYSVDLTTFADGVQFDIQRIVDEAWLWAGLAIDATQATATLSDSPFVRTTARRIEGLPQSLTYAESDFLPRVTPRTTLKTLYPLTFGWQPASTGDAFHLDASWQNDAVGPHNTVRWSVFLPPDSSNVTFPLVDGALAAATSRTEIASRDVTTSYIDSDDHDGFTELMRDGLQLRGEYSSPVELAASPVRTTSVPGCECSAPRMPR